MRRLLPALLLFAVPAAAEDIRPPADDTQLWLTVQGQFALDARHSLILQQQTRLVNNISRNGLNTFRIGLSAQVTPDLALQGGYHLFFATPSDTRPSTTEHRFWQQAQGPAWRIGDLQFSWRAGVEERLFERFADMGLRVRGQLRATTNARLAPVLLTEGFYNLNSTDWGQRAGRDQLRLMAGGSYRLSKHASVEAGYQWIRLWRPGGDRTLNTISATLVLRG